LLAVERMLLVHLGRNKGIRTLRDFEFIVGRTLFFSCCCLLRWFLYAIYFTIEEDIVAVFGLFHCARDIAASAKR